MLRRSLLFFLIALGLAVLAGTVLQTEVGKKLLYRASIYLPKTLEPDMRFAALPEFFEAVCDVHDDMFGSTSGFIDLEAYSPATPPRTTYGDDPAFLDTLDTMLSGNGPLLATVPTVLLAKLPRLRGAERSVQGADLRILSEKFLIPDRMSLEAWLDSPDGQHLILNSLPEGNLVLLGVWEGSAFVIANRKHPVRLPQDLNELSIACLNFEDFGRQTKAMYSKKEEVLRQVEQDRIDGVAQTLEWIAAKGVGRKLTHITVTEHFFSCSLVLADKKKFEALPQEQQQSLRSAIYRAGKRQRERAVEDDRAILVSLKKSGCTIVELTPEERSAWRANAASEGRYDMLKQHALYTPAALDALLKRFPVLTPPDQSPQPTTLMEKPHQALPPNIL